jgi:hypothetical protein
MDREPGKSVAVCHSQRGVFFIWFFLLGRGIRSWDGVTFCYIFVETRSVGEGRCRSQEWSGLLTYLWRSMYTVLQKSPACQPCDILRHPQGAITCETIHPFTGCGAHSALMEDGGTGSFCLLIPQTQKFHKTTFCMTGDMYMTPNLLKTLSLHCWIAFKLLLKISIHISVSLFLDSFGLFSFHDANTTLC